MRKRIKKIIFVSLIVITLIVGFFKIREYVLIKAEQRYGDCTIECDKEARNSRGKLESGENRGKDKNALATIASQYEFCLDVCVNAYKEITGKEVMPIYKILKEQWKLNTSP